MRVERGGHAGTVADSRCNGASRWPAASTTAATTSKHDAQDYARQLRAQGNDVQVGGVPAYSTLGWFNDPLISTFINYPDAELARLIFHELAHQVVYVRATREFNESFATAVEEAGVERWLANYGKPACATTYREYTARKQEFLALLLQPPRRLAKIYASNASDQTSVQDKAASSRRCKRDYQVLKTELGRLSGLRSLVRRAAVQCASGGDRDLSTIWCRVSRPCLRAIPGLQAFYAAVPRIGARLDEAQRVIALCGSLAA